MDVRANAFFAAFDDEMITHLLSFSEHKTYPSGSIIFQENDPSRYVFLVIKGSIEIIKHTSKNETTVLDRLEPGGYFGEMGIIDNCGRSAGAQATQESELVRVPGDELMKILLRSEGKTALHFLQRLNRNLRETNTLFINTLIKKEKMQVVGEMANSIIHDLKTPMTTISLIADLTCLSNQDSQIKQACLNIKKQINHMVAMVQEVLDYSTGNTRLKLKKINLKTVLADIESLMQEYLRNNGVSYNFEPISAQIYVDPDRLTRVFQNLITNAIQAFEGKAGKIDIRAQQTHPDFVIVSVSDNGPGIPMQLRKTFFEPFITGRPGKGIGLGMAIAKSILEAHQGKIDFSTKTGAGTTFNIQLPCFPPGKK